AFERTFGTDNPFDYYAMHPEIEAAINAGMAALAALFADAIVAAYDFPSSGVIVDVGGGQGQLVATVLRARPALRGVLFALPQVVRAAGPLFARAGVADRCEAIGGNMFETVPVGGLYLLSRVLHNWDDAHVVAILETCRKAMDSRSTMLVVERVLPEKI